jgi:O-antigen ligase
LTAWKAALPMWRDFLVTGSGFGSFEDVFQRYVEAGTEKRWEVAHNDYLEVLNEGGLVGGVLVAWLAFAFCIHALRRPGRDRERGPDFERAGLLLGLAAISVHAFVDFNHQIPANALLFVSLAAIAVAARESSRGVPV